MRDFVCPCRPDRSLWSVDKHVLTVTRSRVKVGDSLSFFAAGSLKCQLKTMCLEHHCKRTLAAWFVDLVTLSNILEVFTYLFI